MHSSYCAKPAAPIPRGPFVRSALAFALALAGMGSGAADDAAMIEAGRELALEICAKCHVVAAGQPPPVLRPPAPSFSDIAARPDLDEAWLRAFLSRPHGGERRMSAMAPFLLSASQADQAIAYLMSLKPQ